MPFNTLNSDCVFSCRYQHKCDELEVQAKDLQLKIDTVEKEKKDIVFYLKRRVAKKEDEVTDLIETLSKHQQDQEAERDSFELKLSLLRLELQENKDKFTYENMALGTSFSVITIEILYEVFSHIRNFIKKRSNKSVDLTRHQEIS